MSWNNFAYPVILCLNAHAGALLNLQTGGPDKIAGLPALRKAICKNGIMQDIRL